VDTEDDCQSGDRCREKGQDVYGSAGDCEDINDIQTHIPFSLLWISSISDAYGIGEENHVPYGANGVLKNLTKREELGTGLILRCEKGEPVPNVPESSEMLGLKGPI
jgi:hypothetical protein